MTLKDRIKPPKLSEAELILILQHRLENSGLSPETAARTAQFLIASKTVTFATLFDNCEPSIEREGVKNG